MGGRVRKGEWVRMGVGGVERGGGLRWVGWSGGIGRNVMEGGWGRWVVQGRLVRIGWTGWVGQGGPGWAGGQGGWGLGRGGG